MTSLDTVHSVDRHDPEERYAGDRDLRLRAGLVDLPGHSVREGQRERAKPSGGHPQERSDDAVPRRDGASRKARALMLLLLAGGLFGASPSIGRMSAGLGLPPLGLVFWSNLLAATVCLTWSCIRSGLPRFALADIRFVLGWAIVLGCLYQILTIAIAAHVEASVIALVNSSRGFLVFLLAAALMLEAASLRRFLGLGLGFFAVAGLLASDATALGASPVWLIFCFSLPALLAVHTVIMCSRRTSLGATAAVGAMMAASCLLMLPFAVVSDAIFVPWTAPGPASVLIVALGLSTALALVVAVVLARTAGPVYAGQMAYSQTIGGLMWGFVILDERLAPLAWGAFALLLVGVWIVATPPKSRLRDRPGDP
jgi:drug/metabolite transporter (DMT)-like permease